MARRSGRRPGKQDTRGQIVAAAQSAFADRGFDAATIRQIAADAGVDPALVHHYFGTKKELFLAALDLPVDPADLLECAVVGDRDQTGERLVRAFVTAWDSPVGTAAAALLRSAVANPTMARLFRELVFVRVSTRVVRHLDLPPEEAGLRFGLVASQMAGLAMTRYLLPLEPLASAAPDVVVAAIGPTVQRYLDDDISALLDAV